MTGIAGQFLRKNSDADFDYSWADLPPGGGGASAPESTISGRSSGAGTGPLENLSAAQVKTVLAYTAAQIGAEAAGVAAAIVALHESAGDPHVQYLTPAEGNSLYDSIGSASAAVATHAALSDPHTQYLTSAEGNASYQSIDATLDALAALNATAGLVEQTGADAFTKRAIGVAGSEDIPTRSDSDLRFAALVHAHVAAAISDASAAGLAMLTAADAIVQTALLNTFTALLKGLVPASGGGVINFLRADGSWVAPPGGGGGGSATTVEINLGAAPIRRGRFTITDAAISPTSKVFISQAPGPYTGKGTRTDESEMDRIVVLATPGSGQATIDWETGGAILVPWLLREGSGGGKAAATNPLLSAADSVTRSSAYRTGRVKGNFKFMYQVFA